MHNWNQLIWVWLTRYAALVLLIFLVSYTLNWQWVIWKDQLLIGGDSAFLRRGVYLADWFSWQIPLLLGIMIWSGTAGGLLREMKRNWVLLVAQLLFLGLVAAFGWGAENMLLSLLGLLQVWVLMVLFWVVRGEVMMGRRQVVEILALVGAAQVAVALGQLWLQGDLGLGLLGESAIGIEVLNVAKISWNDGVWLRPYGLFPHANIFGGFCLMVLVLGVQWRLKWWWQLVLGLGLVISFSKSAWLGLLLFLIIVLVRQKKWVMLVIMFVCGLLALLMVPWEVWGMSSYELRLEQWHYALSEAGWIGVGLGNGLLVMGEKLLLNGFYQLQPIHNVLLLLLVELGWGVVVVFALLLIWAVRKGMSDLLILLPILIFDHYLVTAYAGSVTMVLFLALYKRRVYDEKSLELPSKKS